MAGTLKRITRRQRRIITEGERAKHRREMRNPKRLVTHHRPLSTIVESRERYTQENPPWSR